MVENEYWKQIFVDNGHEYYLYLHVNRVGTGIIVSVPVDICTYYILI